MIKMVTTLKRRPGMSVSDFRTYYETHHRLIGEKYLTGYALKYQRRYLDAMPDRDGELREPDYDVLLEIWYPDEATLQAVAERLGAEPARTEIREDEARLFATDQIRTYRLTEHDSEV